MLENKIDANSVNMCRAFVDPYYFFVRYFNDRMVSGDTHIANAAWQIESVRRWGKAARAKDKNNAPMHGRIAEAWPREFGKTTLGLAFMLWSILCGHRKYALVFRVNNDTACSELSDYLRVLSDPTSKIVADFGLSKWIETVNRKRGVAWSSDKMHIPNINGELACIQALGAGTSPRGLEHSGYRPDLIKLDDVETTISVLSRSIRQSNERWLSHDIEPLGANSLILFSQTVISPQSLMSQAQSNGKWAAQRFPALDENDESTWPERYSTEDLKLKRANTPPSVWLNDFQNLPQANDTTLFPTSSWKLYENEGVEPPKRNSLVRVAIGVDLAFSVNQSSDYTAISAWGEDPRGVKHHLKTIRGKWATPEEVVRQIRNVNNIVRADMVVVEDVASSKHFLLFARGEMGYIVKGISPEGLDKTARARSVMSNWELGNVWASVADTLIIGEMYAFRPDVKDQVDDVVDAAVYALMSMKRSTIEVSRV